MKFKRKGISVRVINMSTIKPLDEEVALKVIKCKLVITSEEHSVIGGLGGAVCEYLSSTYPVKLLDMELMIFLVKVLMEMLRFDKYGLRAQT